MALEVWQHKLDGVVTLLGYTIGTGAVFKFPYLVARNGGGAFFIPYVTCLFLCGLPVYYLEIILGQYFQKGPVKVWNFSPAFKGMGVGACMIGWTYATYSSVHFAWFFFYLYNSFQSVLPWTTCDNDWNTIHCIPSSRTKNSSDLLENFNQTKLLYFTSNTSLQSNNLSTSGQEFWRRNTLGITDGLHNIGQLRMPLLPCTIIIFLLFYLFLAKNIKIQGKVMYVTVILPVVLLTVFMIQGSMLPGATDGILYYIKPDFKNLKNPTLWIESCIRSFNTLGVAAGVVITSASHNQRNSNCLRFALTVCICDLFVNLYAGFAMFAVLGHLAYLKNTTLDAFRTAGFDIAFITLPETVANLPFPQLWAVLFVLTVTSLGFDSVVPCLHIVVRVVGDQFPKLTKRRWLHVAVVIVPTFLASLIYTTEGGMYVMVLVEWFIWGPPILIFSLVETLVIGWIFGIPRLSAACREMENSEISAPMKILIKFVSPAFIFAIFIYSMYAYRPPKYGDYIYPGWANAIGWIIVVVIILPLPAWMCYTLYRVQGKTFKEKLKWATDPASRDTHPENDDNREMEPL